MTPLSWVLISVSAILLIILGVWLFYNFYWLNQPQIYLVYTQVPTQYGGIVFSQTDLDNLTSTFNAKFATIAQLNDPGANPGNDPTYQVGGNSTKCLSGFTIDGETSSYLPSWSTQTSTCTKDFVGNVCKNNCNDCTCNNQVNKFYSPNGYWLYGPKPSKSLIDNWFVAPWSEIKYNKFEIFGINKL
jgi:hypothetical protein